MNNLYIIKEVLIDYTPGMAVICASSLERCRELFVKEFGFEDEIYESQIVEFDSSINDGDYKVIEGVNHNEGVVSYVWGGGSVLLTGGSQEPPQPSIL